MEQHEFRSLKSINSIEQGKEASFHEVRDWAKIEFDEQFPFEKNDDVKWAVWRMAYHRGFRQAELLHEIYKQRP